MAIANLTTCTPIIIKQDIYQNFRLIWLDSSMDEQDPDCQNSLEQLHRVVSSINTYTDVNECIKFLNCPVREKVFMIVSGSLGQQIIGSIHKLPQLECIFVFCGDESRHKQWAQEYAKVKGVFTDIVCICEELQLAVRQYDQNSILIGFLRFNPDSNVHFYDLDPKFIYTQLFKDIILRNEVEGVKSLLELASYCRRHKIDEYRITQFELEYHRKTPIEWYTSDCFVSSMLNWALRTLQIEAILKMGFFIHDLHHHIKNFHEEKLKNDKKCFTVYRGQTLSTADFNELKNMGSKKYLMSFNNFFVAKRDRKDAKKSASSTLSDTSSKGVLFTMTIVPEISVNHFAELSINDGESPTAQNILFSIHNVFHIEEIKESKNSSKLSHVKLRTATIEDLYNATKLMRNEIWGLTGWNQLIVLLSKIEAFDKAEELSSVLLEQESDVNKKVLLYQQLGRIQLQQCKYEEAISSYNKGFELRQTIAAPNHTDLVNFYNNMGLIYQNKGQQCNDISCYKRAHSYHKDALEIIDKTTSSNHVTLAACHNYLGNVNDRMGNYEEALLSHQKALEIRKKALPWDHPLIAESYNNIGFVYFHMKKYRETLLNYEIALHISQKALPPNYPLLAYSYNSIGLVYAQIEDEEKAVKSFNEAIKNAQHSLPPNHPHLQMYKDNLARVEKKQ